MTTTERRQLNWVLGIAAVVYFAVALTVLIRSPDMVIIEHNEMSYIEEAQGFLDTGLMIAWERTPFYPLLGAGVLAVFPQHYDEVFVIFTTCLSIISLIFIYQIGRRLFSHRAGIAAATLMGLDPLLLHNSYSIRYPDALFAFVVIWAIYLLLQCFGAKPKMRTIIASAALVTLLPFIKPTGLYLPIIVSLLMFGIGLSRYGLSHALRLTLPFIIISSVFIGGWHYRNYTHSGRFYFATKGAHFLQYVGSYILAYDQGRDFYEVKAELEEDYYNRPGIRAEGPISKLEESKFGHEPHRDKVLFDEAKKIIFAHPWIFGYLTLKGAVKNFVGGGYFVGLTFYDPQERQAFMQTKAKMDHTLFKGFSTALSTGYWGMILFTLYEYAIQICIFSLVGMGLFSLLRRKQITPQIVLIVVSSAYFALTTGMVTTKRYRLLYEGIVMPFAGLALVQILNRRTRRRLPMSLPERRFASEAGQIFFGYYDITPFDRDEDILLAHLGPSATATPRPGQSISIGYFRMHDADSKFIPLGQTTTWCWQQGARLQWVGKSKQVLYNRLVDGRYGAVIQEVESGQIVRTLSQPIYALNREGSQGLTLNFSRLQRLRPGYGYVDLPDHSQGKPSPTDDGIWLVDIAANTHSLILTLKDLADLQPSASMRGAEHYVNHLLFNPSGTRFMFIHLWKARGKKYSRLLTAQPDGSDLYVLADEGLVSHYAWKTDSELLIYSRLNASGTYFHLLRDRTRDFRILGGDTLTQDCHITFSPDGRHLLVDSYPNSHRVQDLALFDLKSETIETIAQFTTPIGQDGEFKADLHPRWSPSGQFVCVDSAQNGPRSIVVLDVRRCL